MFANVIDLLSLKVARHEVLTGRLFLYWEAQELYFVDIFSNIFYLYVVFFETEQEDLIH